MSPEEMRKLLDIENAQKEYLQEKYADFEDQVIEYIADEPVCLACRRDRHEYCIAKKGWECWCEEEEAHGQV